MELIKKYFWQILVVGLVILLFLQHSCQGDVIKSDSNVIITKPKIGGFDYYSPKPIKGIGYVFITEKGDTIKIENSVNKELEQKYLNALSENEKLKLYLEAIQKRTYTDTLENKHLKFSYTALTTGTLDSIKFDYVIKPDTIKIKQPVFSLLGGLTLESNITNPKPTLKANLGFKTSNKDTWLFGANKNEASVTYLRDIFTIKK